MKSLFLDVRFSYPESRDPGNLRLDFHIQSDGLRGKLASQPFFHIQHIRISGHHIRISSHIQHIQSYPVISSHIRFFSISGHIFVHIQSYPTNCGLWGVFQCCFPVLFSSGVFQCCFSVVFSSAVFQCCFSVVFFSGVFQCCFSVLFSVVFFSGVFQCCFSVAVFSGVFQ